MKYVKWMLIIMGLTMVGGLVVGITGKTAGTVLVVELIITGCIIVWLFVSKMVGYVKKESENTSLSTKKKVLNTIVTEALADNNITETELEAILAKKDELNLSDDDLEEVFQKQFSIQAKPVLDVINQEHRCSPEQEKELHEIAQRMKISPDFSDLYIFKNLWHLENTQNFKPPVINVDIRLAQNEECYHMTYATWNQMKKIKERQGYVGASMSFRVAKGVNLRFGRALPVYNEYDQLSEISSGILYITNKKLIFQGNKKSTTITIGRVLSWNVFQDAIEIIKTSGKPDVFMIPSPASIEFTNGLLQIA